MTQEWTDKHYNLTYTLTESDKSSGFVKLDPYLVSKVWKVGSKDDSGALWHCLKTIARFGEKNSQEREIKALYAQIKRLAEINNVELEDITKESPQDSYVFVDKTSPLKPWYPDDSGEWIEYDGSGLPVDGREVIEVLMREEREYRYYLLHQISAWQFSWANCGHGSDIVAYKVCKD